MTLFGQFWRWLIHRVDWEPHGDTKPPFYQFTKCDKLRIKPPAEARR